MKASHLALSLAIALWSSGAAVANDAPPSDESLREMFKLAHTEETMNGMKPQLDAIIATSMRRSASSRCISCSYGPIRRLILKTKSTA